MDVLRAIGIDPYVVYTSGRGVPAYRRNRREFERQAAGRSEWVMGSSWPCLMDRFDVSGVARGQYFHQDLAVAQQIFAAKPARHVDVGSRVDGFVAHVASFMPVEVLDIRPLATSAQNITFIQRDLMKDNPAFDDYTDSLSCLHTLEHFGLGRYGDSIDFDGHIRGFQNLSRMVRAGGLFYLSVPISRQQRVEFDAHRLFSIPYIVDLVTQEFDIDQADVVDDADEILRGVDIYSAAAQESLSVEYGCLILRLRKRR